MARRLANLGAEEGSEWRAYAANPFVSRVAALWEGLFEPEPAFAWLGEDKFYAWLNTDEAEREARAAGVALAGPPPSVVQRVHDKAFAMRFAEAERYMPRELLGATRVFEPDELRDAEAVLREIDVLTASWPEWMGARFTLKPRQGTSGRGRVSKRDDVPGALERLRARGGAVLEPWLERTEDLSALLHLGADGTCTLIGTTRLDVSSSGVYRGQRGRIDSRGRVSSDSPHDEPLREAAAALVNAAAREGYRGPCGVDAFAFRGEGERERLRPIVELNARFTSGIVALGWLRRALPRLRSECGLRPDRPCHFHFALAPPGEEWPELEAPNLVIPLGPDRAGAALVAGLDRDALDGALADSRR